MARNKHTTNDMPALSRDGATHLMRPYGYRPAPTVSIAEIIAPQPLSPKHPPTPNRHSHTDVTGDSFVGKRGKHSHSSSHQTAGKGGADHSFGKHTSSPQINASPVKADVAPAAPAVNADVAIDDVQSQEKPAGTAPFAYGLSPEVYVDEDTLEYPRVQEGDDPYAVRKLTQFIRRQQQSSAEEHKHQSGHKNERQSHGLDAVHTRRGVRDVFGTYGTRQAAKAALLADALEETIEYSDMSSEEDYDEAAADTSSTCTENTDSSSDNESDSSTASPIVNSLTDDEYYAGDTRQTHQSVSSNTFLHRCERKEGGRDHKNERQSHGLDAVYARHGVRDIFGTYRTRQAAKAALLTDAFAEAIGYSDMSSEEDDEAATDTRSADTRSINSFSDDVRGENDYEAASADTRSTYTRSTDSSSDNESDSLTNESDSFTDDEYYAGDTRQTHQTVSRDRFFKRYDRKQDDGYGIRAGKNARQSHISQYDTSLIDAPWLDGRASESESSDGYESDTSDSENDSSLAQRM